MSSIYLFSYFLSVNFDLSPFFSFLIIQIEFSVSFTTFQDFFCSLLFWLTQWASITKTFPSLVSFKLPHMKSDLNHKPNCSSIALFYVFLSSPLVISSTYCSTFCSSCHHFNHSFFSLIPLSYSLLFPC